MADTTFEDQVTVIKQPWAQDVNEKTYTKLSSVGGFATASILLNTIDLISFHDGLNKGGGKFWYDSTQATANHNGITIIDPRNTADLVTWDAAAQTTWFTAVPGNAGCWIRIDTTNIYPEYGGAKRDDSTDDYLPIFNVLAVGGYVSLIGGSGNSYGIGTEIVLNRGQGFIGPPSDFYPTTDQTGSISDRAAVFTWIGASSAGSIVRASMTAVGTEHTDAFNDSLLGCKIQGLVCDGANLIDYGIYVNRALGGEFTDIVTTRTNKHGFYGNGLFSGVYSKIMAFKNNGCGNTFGRAGLDFSWSAAQFNSAFLEDIWGFSNGLDGTFDETTKPLWGYGVGIWSHRSGFINGVRSENNDGPNIVFAPTSYGTSIKQFYSELANSLDIGAGATAISQGRATQKWGLWFDGFTGGASFGNSMDGGSFNGEYVRLTGTEPSTARYGGGFMLYNTFGGSGTSADWGSYAYINSAKEFTDTIVGTSPDLEASAINGYALNPEIQGQASGDFDATAASITTNDTENSSIAYVGVGLYDVSFTDNMEDAFYTVNCPPTAGNRAVYISAKAASGFRIGHTDLAGTLTDASAELSYIVTGRRK